MSHLASFLFNLNFFLSNYQNEKYPRVPQNNRFNQQNERSGHKLGTGREPPTQLFVLASSHRTEGDQNFQEKCSWYMARAWYFLRCTLERNVYVLNLECYELVFELVWA